MALLERVSTLIRANVNDLLSKAEDPEKLARQLVLDMENQLVQVKTQMAIAIADQHLLRKKQADEESAQAEWVRKAELAVAKQNDEVARAALERSLSHGRMAEGLAQQYVDQTEEVESLRSAYSRLQQKMAETRTEVDLLIRQIQRTRSSAKGKAAAMLLSDNQAKGRLDRLKSVADDASARNYAARVLTAVAASESLEERATAMDRDDRVERLLRELKDRQHLLSDSAAS